MIVDQRKSLEFSHYRALLHGVALEELTTGRHVEEQVLHLEITAARTYMRLLRLNLASAYIQACAKLCALLRSAQLHLGYGAYGWQCLASKAHGVKREEVGSGRNLGGGMAFESHAGIGGAHSLAVVHDLNERAACVFYVHLYLGGAGIHGILHQLLHDGGGTLYHLARSNLIGHGVGQKSYHVTHKLF